MGRSTETLPNWLSGQLWIGGRWRDADDGRTFVVHDPGSGRPVRRVPFATAFETNQAIAEADSTLSVWGNTPAEERGRVLNAAAALIGENRQDLALIATIEQGAPLSQSLAQVDGAVAYFEFYAEQARCVKSRQISDADPARRLQVDYRPAGVVGAITPWNAPITAPSRKVAAALAAGCTVVLKPSELTPLSSFALARLLHKAGLPAGAVNVVCGDPESVGKALLAHPAVRVITFTGSVSTGKYLASEAGRHIKRVSLELGGNAPFIVLADADLVKAAKDLVQMKCAHAGQICISANRVLVERPVHDEFVERVLGNLGSQVAGHGTDPSTTIGPMINGAAVRRVADLVREAEAAGARLLCGGLAEQGDLGENFFPPALLDGVRPEMRIAREEIFGPVVAVLDFQDERQAIEIANCTEYGLASYVYTGDAGRGERLARQLDFGLVGVNDPRPLTSATPFGGIKQSGFGREGGTEGLFEFLETQVTGFR